MDMNTEQKTRGESELNSNALLVEIRKNRRTMWFGYMGLLGAHAADGGTYWLAWLCLAIGVFFYYKD